MDSMLEARRGFDEVVRTTSRLVSSDDRFRFEPELGLAIGMRNMNVNSRFLA